MNDKIKSIISYIIVGFVCLVIGAGICFIGLYQYTEKRSKDLNDIITKTNVSLRDAKAELANSKRLNIELRKQIEDSLIDTGKLKSITIDSQSGIDDIIEINRRLSEYFTSIENSK